MTSPLVITGEERPKVELSPESGTARTFAMVLASAFALLLHAGIVLLLYTSFSFLIPEESESQDLEEQVIAIIEIAPPAPEETPIDIGRVNQGQDVGEGETAATGELDQPETEPSVVEEVPEPAEETAQAEEAPETPPEPLLEPPLESEPEPPQEREVAETPPETPPETPVETPPEATPVEDAPPPETLAEALDAPALPEPALPEPAVPEPDATPVEAPKPEPLAAPPTELPEFALLQTTEQARDFAAPQRDEQAIEEPAFDTALTEVLVAAAIEREEQEQEPSGPLAVPPSKPEREVTLPEVPRPVRQQRQARQQQARIAPDERSGRQAQNDSDQSGDGGGYGGGSESNYLGQVARQLNRQKIYPPDAMARGEEGTVVVRFTLDDEGWVIARRILRSSGHRRLDDEVMDLLIRASPLPAPPGNPERLTLTVTLRFYAS